MAKVKELQEVDKSVRVPFKTHRKVKMLAAQSNREMRDIIAEAVALYVQTQGGQK